MATEASTLNILNDQRPFTRVEQIAYDLNVQNWAYFHLETDHVAEVSRYCSASIVKWNVDRRVARVYSGTPSSVHELIRQMELIAPLSEWIPTYRHPDYRG